MMNPRTLCAQTTRLSACVPAIRAARPAEVPAILALFEDEVRAGRMLPRSPGEVRAHLGDWLVAAEGDRVVGCVSLVFFSDELCEVRSLAVEAGRRGRGLGQALVQAALDLAGRRGVRRVLALTRAAPLFEQIGFQRDAVARFPEKVWRDCRPCPLRHRCDEVALIYNLEPPGSASGKDRRV